MIVDIHAHILTEAFLSELADEGAFGIAHGENGAYVFPGYGPLDHWLYDIDARIESLSARDIDLQLVAPPPRMVSHATWSADVEFARRLDWQTADAVAQGAGLLGGLATPAFSEPARAAEELRRAVGEYGFKGVAIASSAAGTPLDQPEFDEMFAVCEELGLFIFMHPTTAGNRAELGDYTLLQLVGWPFETTLAVARMIYAGLFERRPGLKLVLAHGGGTLPWLAGRLDLGYLAPDYEANPDCRANISKRPSEYLKQLYFDTVVASGPALNFLLETIGADHVLFGSDYPFEIGDAEGAVALDAIAQMPESDRDLILGGNARRLLEIA
jgi:aminocarboxymuconate-semialdehyde decarboxylase